MWFSSKVWCFLKHGSSPPTVRVYPPPKGVGVPPPPQSPMGSFLTTFKGVCGGPQGPNKKTHQDDPTGVPRVKAKASKRKKKNGWETPKTKKKKDHPGVVETGDLTKRSQERNPILPAWWSVKIAKVCKGGRKSTFCPKMVKSLDPFFRGTALRRDGR